MGWEESIYLLSLVIIFVLNTLLMLWAHRQQRLHAPECSKYAPFTHDPFPLDAEEPEQPEMPFYCQLNYLDTRPWWRIKWMVLVISLWIGWLGFIAFTFIAYYKTSGE